MLWGCRTHSNLFPKPGAGSRSEGVAHWEEGRAVWRDAPPSARLGLRKWFQIILALLRGQNGFSFAANKQAVPS